MLSSPVAGRVSSCSAGAQARPRESSLIWLVLLTIGMGTAGCGSADVPILPVKGVLTLDGQPLVGATVTFSPLEKGLPASGVTNDRGEFQLTTRTPNDGAIAGEHRISVLLYRAEKPPPQHPPPPPPATGHPRPRPAAR